MAGSTNGIASVSTGQLHTCATTTIGRTKCWGSNGSGRLGNGGIGTFSVTPVDVSNLGTGSMTVSLGGSHSCALTSTGVVKCWGHNRQGQLGDGTVGNKLTPVDVLNLTAKVSGGSNPTPTPTPIAPTPTPTPVIRQESEIVSGGGNHTCAITSGGGLKCWGYNLSGQLGTGNYTSTQTIADVMGLGSGVVAVSAGSAHTCALTNGGSAKCWGANNYGQLGFGSTTSYNVPVDVVGMDINVTAIESGWNHTCALTNSGSVKCWGQNGHGHLGDGTTTSQLAPVDVVGLGSGVAAISAGGTHTCAITSGGGVKCWGNNNQGQLGDGTTTQSMTPVNVSGLTSGVAAISTGWSHTCALTDTGGIKCWGDNINGQLGDSTLVDRSIPRPIF